VNWEDYENRVESNPKNQVKVKVGGEEVVLKGWDAVVYRSLTLPYGYRLLFWDDGEVSYLQTGEFPSSTEDLVAVHEIVGVENLDYSVYEDGFLWDEEKGGWIDPLSDKEVVLKNFDELIAYLISEVGLLQEQEELMKEVEKQFWDFVKGKEAVEEEKEREEKKGRTPDLEP